jgi:hypothetical protein
MALGTTIVGVIEMHAHAHTHLKRAANLNISILIMEFTINTLGGASPGNGAQP